MNHRLTIECKPNGPYLVSGLDDLRNSKGETILTKSVMALCRCGGSASKPFCDGTHQKNGFSGAKLTDGSNDKRDTYLGRGVTIHDNRGICAHAGRCTDGLAAVFKYGSEPWIDPNAATLEQIVETVKKCPSGALSYAVDGVEHRDQEREPAVSVGKDGPYEIVGAVDLIGQAWGDGASREHYTLCRCGGSKNKPFCDGTHWSIDFKDEKN